MYVYLITNLINNKKYVGQTIQPPHKRWIGHKLDSKNPKMVINIAMRKYGVDNFKFEVIDESASDRDELNDLEEFYVSFYDTFKSDGYNCTSGGEGYVVSKEIKRKMSSRMKGVGNPFFGKSHSEETKREISKSCKGRKISDETRKKLSAAHNTTTGILSSSSKKITQINKDTNEEIACWFSMGEIERELGIRQSNISSCCRGKEKSAGGFIWKYITP